MIKLRTGPWNLTDLKDVPQNGKKVFSIFHCGGGSTMGYKLAGYEVLGGVEIDPEMMNLYRANHNPKHSYLMSITDFNKLPRDKIPKELFGLDILDGSPPCSSFSMAGSREKAWGDKKKFREGQADQVLDDLFFHFIETAKILQPKVVVAENVKGLLMGKAKGYVKQIAQQFNLIGYDLQLFLLNAAFMGVPQRRERSFFIAKKRSIKWPKLELKFNEKTISVKDAFQGCNDEERENLPNCYLKHYCKIKPGGSVADVNENGSGFQSHKLAWGEVAPTMSAQSWHVFHPAIPKSLSKLELLRLQSFPDDYFFLKKRSRDVGYITGMSVPPFMMQRVADQIYKQWLSN